MGNRAQVPAGAQPSPAYRDGAGIAGNSRGRRRIDRQAAASCLGDLPGEHFVIRIAARGRPAVDKDTPGSIHRHAQVHLLIRTSIGAGGSQVAQRIIDEDIQIGIGFGSPGRQDDAEERRPAQVERVEVRVSIVGVEILVGVLNHGIAGDRCRDQTVVTSRIRTVVAKIDIKAG